MSKRHVRNIREPFEPSKVRVPAMHVGGLEKAARDLHDVDQQRGRYGPAFGGYVAEGN